MTDPRQPAEWREVDAGYWRTRVGELELRLTDDGVDIALRVHDDRGKRLVSADLDVDSLDDARRVALAIAAALAGVTT